MQTHGTPVLDRPTSATAATSPVIGVGRWFEPAPFVLRVERPLEFGEMVAALYSSTGMTRDDLADPEDVWGQIAIEVTTRGLIAIDEAADSIEHAEQAGGWLSDPAWLAFCRERVSALVSARLAA